MQNSSDKLHDLWMLKDEARALTAQAQTLAMQHISDGFLQMEFIHEIQRIAQRNIIAFEQGDIHYDEAKRNIKKEKHELLEQSYEIIDKGVDILVKLAGLAAGTVQVVDGAAMCIGSWGVGCVLGVPLMANGTNGMYENAVNLWNGDSKAEGWTRDAYREIAKMFGGDDNAGDLLYSTIDLGLSGYGLANKLKPSINALEGGTKRFKLFEYVSQDFSKGYRTMSVPALSNEIFVDGTTLYSAFRSVDDK
ncbi:DUF4225 domain-containing protein [Photobacterium indicum]|uniref:DUF4225 domain-containing protein n=1 Tax=Photobacterium indicum TaxID=81447 RepID=UPI003D095F17